MNVVVPLARRNCKAMLCYYLAGSFEAIAYLRPPVAVMLAKLPLQGAALILGQGPKIGTAHCRRCNRYSRSDVQLNAYRQLAPALAEINHAEPVARADRARTAGLSHQFIAKRLGQMPNAEICKGGIPQRHG